MLSLGLLIVSGLILLPVIGLALYLSYRTASDFAKLNPIVRLAKFALIFIVLLPISWPYIERLAAQQRCHSLSSQDKFSKFKSATLQIRIQGNADPQYLIGPLGPEWLLENKIQSISYREQTQVFEQVPLGHKCDEAAGWQQYGYNLCRKTLDQRTTDSALTLDFESNLESDNKSSVTTVKILHPQSGAEIARFGSFLWYPSFGSFILGNDLPVMCRDGYEFSRFLHEVIS